MRISMIVAFDDKRAIGKDNKLPWHLPADLAFVKEKTIGKSIVMGRKNFESIGRPLPGRKNIVMTRDKSFIHFGVDVAHTIMDVANMCYEEDEVFIFGGQEIYELFMKAASTLYVTKIKGDFNGDTFFPEINPNEWREVSKTKGTTDSNNLHEHDFYVYKRILTK